MTEPRSTIIDINSDDEDDTYEPNSAEPRNTIGMMNALDYIGVDHPLLPPPRHRSASSAGDIRSRIRNHAEFWWNIFVTIQERIRPDQNPNPYQFLRAELTKLRQANEQLQREADRQQRTYDKAIIA